MTPLDALIARPIAHRGLHDGNKSIMENSLSAIIAAADAGYAIEIDVQLSADNVAIMFHDETLDRLTAKTGLVSDYTAKDLLNITLGDTADTLLPLATVLATLDGRAPIVVEMKDNGSNNPALAKAVAEDLLAYEGPCAAMSFAYDLVTGFAQLAPSIAAGLTAQGITDDKTDIHRTFLERTSNTVSFIAYGVTDLPNALVTEMRETRDMKVITWTVRDAETHKRCAAHVDQITFELFVPDEII